MIELFVKLLEALFYFSMSILYINFQYLITSITQIIQWFNIQQQPIQGYIIFGIIIFIIFIALCKQGQLGNDDEDEDIQYRGYKRYQKYHKFPQKNFNNYQVSQNNYSYNPAGYYQKLQQTKKNSQNQRYNSQKIEIERKKSLKKELKENREMISLLYQNKEEIYLQNRYQTINRAVLQNNLEICTQKIEYLQEKGKALFLGLANIQNGVCRVDFHKFYKAEIKAILDGLLEKIRLYKYSMDDLKVKLIIIVGKGKNSKNGIPVIGPLVQDYLRNYLSEEVEIINGCIEVYV